MKLSRGGGAECLCAFAGLFLPSEPSVCLCDLAGFLTHAVVIFPVRSDHCPDGFPHLTKQYSIIHVNFVVLLRI